MSTQSNTNPFNNKRPWNPVTGNYLKSNTKGSKSRDSSVAVSGSVSKLEERVSKLEKASVITSDIVIDLWNKFQDFSMDFFNLSNRVQMSDACREESKKWVKPTLYAIVIYLIFFWYVIKIVSIFIFNK